MKIAQVTYLYEPSIGGVESHVKNLSEQLVLRGHTVHVLTSNYLTLDGSKRIQKNDEVINGVNVQRFDGSIPTWKNFDAQKINFGPLKDVLINGNYDIVHCHSIPSDHFIQVCKIYENQLHKIFVTPHFSPDDLARTFRTKLTPWYWRFKLIPMLKKINRIIAVSSSEKEMFLSLTHIPNEKFVMIPNAVSFQEIDNVGLSEIQQFQENYKKNKKMVIFVGRIVRTKGIDILLRAVAQLERNDYQLIIIGPVGDKDYYGELQSYVFQNNLKEKVVFMQISRSEVLKAFHACDVLVLPTRGEVFGIVLAEAMACSKIVVGTNVGGLPDLIKNNENGFLFELENSNELAQILKNILDNQGDLNKIRNNARQTIEQNYNWETNAAMIDKIYQE